MLPRNKLILAIDPGPEKSGYVLFRPAPDGGVVHRGVAIDKGHVDNEQVAALIRSQQPGRKPARVIVEMVGHYGTGMAAGKTVFRTCVWIGRFCEIARYQCGLPFVYVYQPETRLALCGQRNAKKANVRQALLDLFGPKGTKKEPGPTYGFNDHTWSALALVVAYYNGFGREQFETG